jgi:hypothetical protein
MVGFLGTASGAQLREIMLKRNHGYLMHLLSINFEMLHADLR